MKKLILALPLLLLFASCGRRNDDIKMDVVPYQGLRQTYKIKKNITYGIGDTLVIDDASARFTVRNDSAEFTVGVGAIYLNDRKLTFYDDRDKNYSLYDTTNNISLTNPVNWRIEGNEHFYPKSFTHPSNFPTLLTVLPDTIDRTQGFSFSCGNCDLLLVALIRADSSNSVYKSGTNTVFFDNSDMAILTQQSTFYVTTASPVTYQDSNSFESSYTITKPVYIKN